MTLCCASLLFAFLFPDLYFYQRISISSCGPSPSLTPPPPSSQPFGAPPRTESKDSESTVGEVDVRKTGPPATADPVALEVTVVMAVGTSEEVAGASQDTALALSSLPASASPSAPLGTGASRLDDDVFHQFDATHRLSELTAAWGNLATFATSFGEKLQVSFSEILS